MYVIIIFFLSLIWDTYSNSPNVSFAMPNIPISLSISSNGSMIAGVCDSDDILYVYQQTSSTTYQLIDKQSNGRILRSVHMGYDASYLVAVEQFSYTVY